MTARDVKRSALGMGRILLGVIMAICVPVWLVFSLVDYTRPTVPANELVTRPSRCTTRRGASSRSMVVR